MQIMKNRFSIKRELIRFFSFTFVFITLCTFAVKNYINLYFSTATLQEILFFIQSLSLEGIKGADTNMTDIFIESVLIKSALYSLLIVFLPPLCSVVRFLFTQDSFDYKLSCNGKFFNSVKFVFLKIKSIFNFFNKHYLLIVFGISFATVVYFISVFAYKIYLLNALSSDFYEKNYVAPTKNIIHLNKKKNLLILHVESLEKTFSDKDFFGKSLLPDLDLIAQNGIQFDNYVEGLGQSFTTGSMVALFTGLPLTPFGRIADFAVNKNGKYLNIFKNAYSLIRILKDYDYDTYTIIPASADYGGKRQFLSLHGMDSIIDKIYIKRNRILPNALLGSWGYNDKDILSVVKYKLSTLSADHPFLMYVQTVDTHIGYTPYDLKEKKFDNVYHNFIYNTNLALAEFLNWLKLQPYYKDTIIVILGDHLRMGQDFPMPKNRKIYNLFLNVENNGLDTHRTFSSIDLFPSILEAMGAKIDGHKLGLGTSIFSDSKTLSEKFSQEELDNELSKKNKLYDSLW